VEGEEAWQPDYATLTWVVQHSLRLAAPCVLGEQQRKAMFLKTLVMLITGPASRVTDAAVLMEVLAIVRKWLIDPPPSAGARHSCPNARISSVLRSRSCPLGGPGAALSSSCCSLRGAALLADSLT